MGRNQPGNRRTGSSRPSEPTAHGSAAGCVHDERREDVESVGQATRAGSDTCEARSSTRSSVSIHRVLDSPLDRQTRVAVARRGGWRRRGGQAGPVRGRARPSDHRRGGARAGREPRDPACVEGRVDLAEPQGEAPGNGRRPCRASPVPVPPRVPRGAGGAEVRPSRPFRGAPASAARDDRGARRARAVRARLGLRPRRDARQPRMVPGRLGAVRPAEPDIRRHDAREAARERPGAPARVPVPLEATAHGAADDRRRPAGRRRARAARAPRRCSPVPLRAGGR